jgi:cytochrome c oxidase assembly protein subunit 15
VSTRISRALLWIAFVLAFVVLGTSSGLRLATNGLGCEPWPRCYGETSTGLAAQQSGVAQAARLAHRVAASAFALVALGAVVLGWRAWRRPARVAAVVLLAVTATLAVVGRFTPSPLPAVTLINVLGGLALLGGTALLLAARNAGAAAPGLPRWAMPALLMLLALQAAAGTMVSVRLAGAACERSCAAKWLPGTTRLWDPLQPGAATDLVRGAHAGEALHATHRLLAIVITALTAAVAVLAPRRRVARWPLAALAACVTLGLALASLDGSLGLAVAHALGAGALAAGMGLWLAGGSGGREIA